MRNSGILIEEQLCKALHKKHIKQLNQNLQTMVLSIFKDADLNSKIECKLTDNYVKPDIILKWKQKTAYISVKLDKQLSYMEKISNHLSCF